MTMDDDEPFCYTCVSSAYWMECESCDHGWIEADWDGYSDDGDDDCMDRCQWCHGEGGWWVCLGTEHHNLDEGSIHRVPLNERANVN